MNIKRLRKNKRRKKLETHLQSPLTEVTRSSTLYRAIYEKGKQEGMRNALPYSLTNRVKKNFYPPIFDKELTVHAFISAKNEEHTIKEVIENVFDAGVHKVIVVANGCLDKTSEIAKNCGAVVLDFKEALGYDVGRAIGLQHEAGDINLVLDADFILTPEEIKPFINAVSHGVDIALNDLNPLYYTYAKLDRISLLKYVLNFIIDKEYLGVNSLTAVPHALSKKAVKVISPKLLAVPPKALVRAAFMNLNVQSVATVDVFKPNKIRPEIHKNNGVDLAESLIIGDHLEAISYYLFHTDWRGGKTDLDRKRELINE